MSSSSWKKIILNLIFLILSIFYSVIFYQHAELVDATNFNIEHIKSLTNVFVSPINFDFWNHSGSQINLFSPWLTLLPGLAFLNFNVNVGLTMFIGLITFLTFVSAYHYMFRFSRDTLEALLFSFIYVYSFNRFWLVFQQQRIENYLVMIFLPMVYYGMYQLLHGEFHQWYLVSLGMPLIVWTSPYMALGVFITLMPMVILMIFSKRSHHWNYWGKLCLGLMQAVFLTVLMTVGFTGPLLENQLEHPLKQMPMQNFNYIKWYRDLNFTTVQTYLLLVIAVLLGLLMLLIFFKSSFTYKMIMLEMIPLTAMLLIKFSLPVDISRLINSFQSILDLFLAIVVSRIIIMLFQEAPVLLKLGVLILAVLGLGGFNYVQANQIKAPVSISQRKNTKTQQYVVNYHDDAKKSGTEFLVNGRVAKVSFYTQGSDYWIQYYNPQSVTMDLPIQNYSGYRVQLNNENVKTRTSQRNTLELQTNPGKNIIEIHAKYTLLGYSCLLLNLCGFVLLGYLFVNRGYWNSRRK